MKIEKEIIQVKPFKSEGHKTLVNLIYTGKWIIYKQKKLLKKYNLTLPQYNMLRILKGVNETTVSINYIKRRMMDKNSDVSRIVEKLRRKKLVDRKIDSIDRRGAIVSITQEGLDLLDEIEKIDFEMIKSIKNLDKNEMNQLNFLLDKLRD